MPLRKKKTKKERKRKMQQAPKRYDSLKMRLFFSPDACVLRALANPIFLEQAPFTDHAGERHAM